MCVAVKTKGLKRGYDYDSHSDRKRRKKSGANEDDDYSSDSAADYAEECKAFAHTEYIARGKI